MDDSRKIAMTSTSAYLTFTGTLAEQANIALWQKATLCREKSLPLQMELLLDFLIKMVIQIKRI